MRDIFVISTLLALLIVGCNASHNGIHKQWGLPHVGDDNAPKELSDLVESVSNLLGPLQDNVKKYKDCKSQYDTVADAVKQCLKLLTGFSVGLNEQKAMLTGENCTFAEYLAKQQALMTQNPVPATSSVTIDISSTSTAGQQQGVQQQSVLQQSVLQQNVQQQSVQQQSVQQQSLQQQSVGVTSGSLDRENRSKNQAAEVVGQALSLGLGAVETPVVVAPDPIHPYVLPANGGYFDQGYGNYAYQVPVPVPGAWGYSSYSQYPAVQGVAFGGQYSAAQAIPGYQYGAGQGQGAGYQYGAGQGTGYQYGAGQGVGYGVPGKGAGVQSDFSSQQTVQAYGASDQGQYGAGMGQGQGQIDSGMQYPSQAYWNQGGQSGAGYGYQGAVTAQNQGQTAYTSQTQTTTGAQYQGQGQGDYSTAQNSGIQFPLQGVLTQTPGQPASGFVYSAQGGLQNSAQSSDFGSQYQGQTAYAQVPGQTSSTQYYYQGASQYPVQTAQSYGQDGYSIQYGVQGSQNAGQVGSTATQYGYGVQGSQGMGQGVLGASQYGHGVQGSQSQGAGQTSATRVPGYPYGSGAQASQGVSQTVSTASTYGYGVQGSQDAGQSVSGTSQYGYGVQGSQGVGQTLSGSAQYGYGAQGSQGASGAAQYGYGVQGSQDQSDSESQYGYSSLSALNSAQQSTSGGSSQYGYQTSVQNTPGVSQYWIQLQPVTQGGNNWSYQYQQGYPNSANYVQTFSQQQSPSVQVSSSSSTSTYGQQQSSGKPYRQ